MIFEAEVEFKPEDSEELEKLGIDTSTLDTEFTEVTFYIPKGVPITINEGSRPGLTTMRIGADTAGWNVRKEYADMKRLIHKLFEEKE